MSYDDIDEQFKKLVKKADLIYTREKLGQYWVQELTKAREQDGRYKIAIIKKQKELDQLKINIDRAALIRAKHYEYFDIIFDESIDPKDILDVLLVEFEDFAIKAQELYYPALEEYRKLVGHKSQEQNEKDLVFMKRDIEDLEQKRMGNQDLILSQLNHLNKTIENLKS